MFFSCSDFKSTAVSTLFLGKTFGVFSRGPTIFRLVHFSVSGFRTCLSVYGWNVCSAGGVITRKHRPLPHALYILCFRLGGVLVNQFSGTNTFEPYFVAIISVYFWYDRKTEFFTSHQTQKWVIFILLIAFTSTLSASLISVLNTDIHLHIPILILVLNTDIYFFVYDISLKLWY